MLSITEEGVVDLQCLACTDVADMAECNDMVCIFATLIIFIINIDNDFYYIYIIYIYNKKFG